MHAAWQARIEAAYCAHDVDAFELVRTVLLKQWGVLHGIFVRPRGAVNVTRVGVPARRRIRMIVGNLAVTNDHMMREHAAHSLVESAGDCVLGHLERRPGFRAPAMSSSMAF